MKDTELAYAAGFFDGEGSLTIARQKREDLLGYAYHLRVQLTGTDKRPLLWFQERFGGSIMLRTNTGPRNKPLYQYCVASRKALAFLKAVEPYLIIKRALARVGINFQETRRSFSQKGPRTLEERAFMESCRQKVLGLNYTRTKKGGKRRW